jgi:hypothetical protein
LGTTPGEVRSGSSRDTFVPAPWFNFHLAETVVNETSGHSQPQTNRRWWLCLFIPIVGCIILIENILAALKDLVQLLLRHALSFIADCNIQYAL